MAKLMLHMRPYVAFDVTNRKHRWWLSEFLRTNSWAACPVLFDVEDATGELVPTMIRQMAEYYSNRQFAKLRTDV